MVSLCHGRPIVTTSGSSTEPLWRETEALKTAPVGDLMSFLELVRQLRNSEGERARMGQAAQTLYKTRFDMPHTIAALRQA
jgi:hypothetical protein